VIKFLKIALIGIVAVAAVGCTRIESGTVGVRVDMSRQIQGNELPAGSWNQTLVGDVLTFPVKDIVVGLENKTPLTSDNSALADFDITLVYGINPSSVAELYTTKSKSFHAQEQDGDTLLMYTYVSTLVNNASYKAVRGYKALEVADNRAKIEAEIKATVEEQLKEEKLDAAINVSVVQIRNIAPNAEIMQAATAYVRSQNEFRQREVEVKVAELEAKRMQILSSNSTQNIAYINAQANMKIAEAVASGKVQTILIPHNMTMLGSLK
jgi:regulator of protease activity HflC (stomatin/prohibitin superfamily)